MSDETKRSIEEDVSVDAPPREVWEALTTTEGLRRWFPLDGRVEAGEGGEVWLSWGPGMEASAPIHVWDPPRRFGWSESYGEDESGRPVKITVDFHVEGRSGVTAVRVVQSGFSAAAEWDEMFDAVRDGWRYFLFNLAYYLREHRGTDRDMVWRRFATELSRDEVWERLTAEGLVRLDGGEGAGRPAAGTPLTVSLDGPVRGKVVSARPGHHLAAELPDLENSLLFVEIEGAHVGVWLSTYGLSPEKVEALQTALDERVGADFGVA